jgi:Holliday junction DNA helicase RuvA
MYEYIKGAISGLTPAGVVMEAAGVGYFLHISVNTFSRLKGNEEGKLFIHQVVREDAHLLYGFSDQEERDFFRLLIGVNGIGASIAIMMLSSYLPEDLRDAILSDNVNLLKSIKGIGAKTAQRVIIELKDKVGKGVAADKISRSGNFVVRNEALSALEMLGFNKKAVENSIDQILASKPDLTVEQLLKIALKSF